MVRQYMRTSPLFQQRDTCGQARRAKRGGLCCTEMREDPASPLLRKGMLTGALSSRAVLVQFFNGGNPRNRPKRYSTLAVGVRCGSRLPPMSHRFQQRRTSAYSRCGSATRCGEAVAVVWLICFTSGCFLFPASTSRIPSRVIVGR